MKINYNRSREIIEIKVFDSTMQKLEKYTANNQKDYSRILSILKEKYGFEPTINQNDSINDSFFDY